MVNSTSESGTYRLPLIVPTLLLAVIWSALIILFDLQHRKTMREQTMDQIRTQAKMAFENVVVFRRWNARHGGVYVPIDSYGIPNPYLKGLVKRDLVTTEGDSLTMINPAYMTRQFFDLLKQDTQFRGHITSLRPIRPENAPDPWESKSLTSFENGVKETSTFSYQDSATYFRFMRPLFTEKPCLKCHAKQGYREGDIRGGISISIPVDEYLSGMNRDIQNRTLTDVIFWAIGIAGLIFGYVRIRRADLQREHLLKELEDANTLKLMLIDVMTHDLRKPLQVISGFAELAKGEDPDNMYLKKIDENTKQLSSTLEDVSVLAQVSLGESIPKKTVDLAIIIRQVVDEYQDLLEAEQMELNLDLPDSCPVSAHPIVREVVRNYLNNALKYASLGKRIDILLEETDKDVIFFVKDYGPLQIPPSNYSLLFARQYRREIHYKGRGLGLFIVGRIARSLGGNVWCKPNHPQGNIFAFSLPREENRTPAQSSGSTG
ncbi:MAG: DUF3365 domain-containing protein [Candidatus Neomarinimicrobiota bacterium]|nr:MAG: DUF3365 domain-containing protein [Candidatus Neomarinimicrobiota bacterium]